MTTKKDVSEEPLQWNGQVVQTRIPSGVKLTIDADFDALLRFVGRREVPAVENDEMTGEIYTYLSFYDGKKVVSVHESFAFRQSSDKLTPGHFYYLHNNGTVACKVGEMQDLEIIDLGAPGNKIGGIPDFYRSRLLPDGGDVFEVSDGVSATLNYGYLNYPLRSNKHHNA